MENRHITRTGQLDEKDIRLLSNFPFFQDLQEAHLRAFLDNAIVLQCDAAQTIIRRGEPANSFFVILNGRINVGVFSDHKFISVQTLTAGNILGWSWIVPPHRWRFDAIALERSRILMLEGAHIRTLCEQNHGLGYDVMKRIAVVLAGRLESTRLDLIGQPTTSF